jgi:hypothetical protein
LAHQPGDQPEQRRLAAAARPISATNCPRVHIQRASRNTSSVRRWRHDSASRHCARRAAAAGRRVGWPVNDCRVAIRASSAPATPRAGDTGATASVPRDAEALRHLLRWHYPDQVQSVSGGLATLSAWLTQAPVAVGHLFSCVHNVARRRTLSNPRTPPAQDARGWRWRLAAGDDGHQGHQTGSFDASVARQGLSSACMSAQPLTPR